MCKKTQTAPRASIGTTSIAARVRMCARLGKNGGEQAGATKQGGASGREHRQLIGAVAMSQKRNAK